MSVTIRDNKYHTYRDYVTWSRTSGDELIGGTAYVKDPGPTLGHQIIVGELYHQARVALQGTPWHVILSPFDVRLPAADERNADVDTVVQPDVFITRDPSKLDARGMRGAPDWLVEVLSPGTTRYDQSKKVPAYERARVPEVWLVDPRHRNVAIYDLSAEGVYGKPRIVGMEGRTPLSVEPRLIIDWQAILAQLR